MVLLHEINTSRGGTDHEPTLPIVAGGKPRAKRFVVSEQSMLPTLMPGDGLVAIRSSRLRRGQIRCFEHPDRPGFWLVKRVGDVRGDRFEARSDHDAPGVTDSRHFGFVPAVGSYRMLFRVPRRLLGGGSGPAS